MATPAQFVALTGGNGFNPFAVSGLALWYDLTAPSSLFVDAGITPVSADSDPIYRVNDKGGLGNHLTQTTLGNRPLYRKNILGQSSVSRHAATSYWTSAAFAAPITQPDTVFFVAKLTSIAASQFFFSSVDGVNFQDLLMNAGYPAWDLYAGTELVSGASAADTSYHIFVCIFNGATSKLYVDGGAAKQSGAAGANSLNAITLGANAGGASGITGDIAHFLLYTGIKSVGEINLLCGGLAAKLGLPWTTAT